MALNTQLSDAVVSAQADVLARLLDNGYLRLSSGTQPADANTALGAQVLLAELRFAATSAPAAVGGVLTFNSLTSDSDANADGTASFFRAVGSNGTSVVFDGSIGTSNANMIIPNTTIAQHQTVSCSSFVHDVKNNVTGL
jgi:hypothetical protein